MKTTIASRLAMAKRLRRPNVLVAIQDLEELLGGAPAPEITPESLRSMDHDTLAALKSELKSYKVTTAEWTPPASCVSISICIPSAKREN